jgi:chromosome segregation ATPase
MSHTTQGAGSFVTIISEVHQELYSCHEALAKSNDALQACETKLKTGANIYDQLYHRFEKTLMDLHSTMSKNLTLAEELVENEDIRSNLEKGQKALEIKLKENEERIASLEQKLSEMDEQHEAICTESSANAATIKELERVLEVRAMKQTTLRKRRHITRNGDLKLA